MPNASSKSADPLLEDAALLPCFITLAPAAVVTIAALVEILMVLKPSPPVPTTSTARSGTFISVAC